MWQQFGMPQVQLPIFPAGVTHINSEVAFEERDGKVYYFNGHLPVFVHEKSALATFRLFSTQLVINGNATGSGDLSCIRGTAGHGQTLCEALSGAWSSGLFCTCQEALGQQIDCGSLPTGSRLIGPGTDCARSGSGGGDFVKSLPQGGPFNASRGWQKKDLSNDAIASTKSERSIADIQAPLGRATTRSLERVAASVGMLNGAPIEFELVKDVPDGGVLFALPALLLLGLLSKSREMFSMPEGFYPLESIFLLLALMAPGAYSFARSVALCGAGRMGQVDGARSNPRSAHP